MIEKKLRPFEIRDITELLENYEIVMKKKM